MSRISLKRVRVRNFEVTQHFLPNIKKINTNKFLDGFREICILFIHGGIQAFCIHYGNQYEVSSKNYNWKLPTPSVIPLMRLSLKDFKSLHHRDNFTSMFIAALLTIARK